MKEEAKMIRITIAIFLMIYSSSCTPRHLSTSKSVENSTTQTQMQMQRYSKENIKTEEWGNKPQDAEVIFALLKKGERVALAIIVEDVDTPGVKSDTELEQLNGAVKDKLLAELEYVHLYAFGKARTFSLIDRNSLKALLDEHALNASGLVSDDMRIKIGNLAGATHILLVKLTFLPEGETQSLEYRKLIEVSSGKILAVAVRAEKKR